MAEHVDHVFPWRHFGAQAFRLNLFQSLCKEHHSHKTQLEQRGVYEHYQGAVKRFSDADYIPSVMGGGGTENFET